MKRADETTLIDYNDIINEQLNAGIIEEVDPKTIPIYNINNPVHYLPHHMVKQDGKRGRIVYDASAKVKDQKSLNENMYRGPSMLEDLTALLLKFRTGKIGISADVEKAFLQISLQEEDRDVTRFLWVKDVTKELSENNVIHYRFCRVPFGIIASPFLLTATIRYHMSKTSETLLKKVADRCYVDNLVTEAKSQDEALELYKETRETFNKLSMNIRDWISNDKEFMEKIPKEHRMKGKTIVKILGILWNVKDDILKLKLPKYEDKSPVTKKEVLRTLARLYDPCGFASPYILPAKLMFQQTCIRKLNWDCPLPADLLQSWPNVIENIEGATIVEIPRYIGHGLTEDIVIRELHCFTDASKNAYAAVVYLVSRTENKSYTSLLMSKSRITPIEDKDDLKIPRLELLGYLIGSRLLRYVAENLDLDVAKKYLWTDSMIVLSWMKTSRLMPPFVSRRVNEIKQNKDFDLRYVPTTLNPADIATRPDSVKLKKELWFSGPTFLMTIEREWPASKPENLPSLAEEVLMISEGPEMAGKGYEDIFDTQFPEQDTNDVETSMKEIIDLQAKYFPDEVAGKRTSLSRNLDLFRDVDGTLRCGGRMKNAEWSYESKHPILIPKLCDFTNSIILRTHQDNYHVGVSHTLSLIRKMYWIPQGRAQVKQILKTCPQCVKHSGGPYRLPDAPDLPVERVTFSVPFTFTGMDYFGPIFVEVSEKKEKRWVCLFTCLAVRAIHLEVVNDLTAEECLLAVRRFVACRGKPSLIVSDNATQFRLTSEIFIDRQCARSNIKWKFIPQLAPWHGGVYERLIGVVKNCLKRTLDKHLLKEGQLMTIIKEVETVVNSRPLTTLTPEIEHILRPADFLTLGKCLELIPPDDTSEGTSTKIDLVKSWKRGQRIMQDFKLMFRDQYLPSLRERYFQRPKQPRITSGKSPRVGDLVQIKDDSRNRLNWRVGKISTLVESQDGKCRVAKVQVGNQVFTRSIAHLYPLEAEVGSIERVPTTGNHTDQVPKEREPRFEVETPEVACDADIITEGEVNGPHSIPRSTEGEAVVREPFIEESTEISASEADKVANRVTDGRVRREAAIRARERIAEWTQQLFILL
ncbi:uncharacterized protein LOC126379949 isoform X2 [Pectinophora gossypiella]|nr:uncharacterized protein LOC126379949 isoform X2 [Pectinophora gossypiella]